MVRYNKRLKYLLAIGAGIAVAVAVLFCYRLWITHLRYNLTGGVGRSTIHLLATACEYYRADCGEYPPSEPIVVDGRTWEGRHRLVMALARSFTGPRGRRVCGPYNGAEQCEIRYESDGIRPYFVDPYGNPFFYYRLDQRPQDVKAKYHFSDNTGGPGPTEGEFMEYLKGARHDVALMSKGSDGQWDLPGKPVDDIHVLFQD